MAFTTSKKAVCYIVLFCAILVASAAAADGAWYFSWTTDAQVLPFYSTSTTPDMCNPASAECTTDLAIASYNVVITTVCYDILTEKELNIEDCDPDVIPPVSDVTCNCASNNVWKFKYNGVYDDSEPTEANRCVYTQCPTPPADVEVVCYETRSLVEVDLSECLGDAPVVAVTCQPCGSWSCKSAADGDFSAAACLDEANYTCDVATTCPTPRDQLDIEKACKDAEDADVAENTCPVFTPVDIGCECSTPRWEFKYMIGEVETISPDAPANSAVCDYSQCIVADTTPVAAVSAVCRLDGATVTDDVCESLPALTLPVCDACAYSFFCKDLTTDEFSTEACLDETNFVCGEALYCPAEIFPEAEKKCIVNGNVALVAADETSCTPLAPGQLCECLQFQWQYAYTRADGTKVYSTDEPASPDVCSYATCVADSSVAPTPDLAVVCFDLTGNSIAGDASSCKEPVITITATCSACGTPAWSCPDSTGAFSSDACADEANYECDVTTCSEEKPAPVWTLSQQCLYHNDVDAVSTDCPQFVPSVQQPSADCSCPLQYEWAYKYTIGTGEDAEDVFSATTPIAADVCDYAQCLTATTETPVTPLVVEVVCRLTSTTVNDEECEIDSKPVFTPPTCDCTVSWVCEDLENKFSTPACDDKDNYTCSEVTCPDVSIPVVNKKKCIVLADMAVVDEVGTLCGEFKVDVTAEDKLCKCTPSIYQWKFSYGDVISDDEPTAADACSYKTCIADSSTVPTPVTIVCYNTEDDETAEEKNCQVATKPSISIKCDACHLAWACPTATTGLSAQACASVDNYSCDDERCVVGEAAVYVYPHKCVYNNDASAEVEFDVFCGDFKAPVVPTEVCECDALWYFEATTVTGDKTYIPEQSYVDSASCDYTLCLKDETPTAKAVTVVCFKPTAESIEDPTKGIQDNEACKATQPSAPVAAACEACASEWVCSGEFNDFTTENCAEKDTNDYKCNRESCLAGTGAVWTLGQQCTYNGDLKAISTKCADFTSAPTFPTGKTCTCPPTACAVLTQTCGENGSPNPSCSKCLCKAGFSGLHCQYSKNVAVGLTFGQIPADFQVTQEQWETDLITAVSELMVIPSELIAIPEESETPSAPFVALAIVQRSDNTMSVGMTISTQGSVSEADIKSKWTENVTVDALNAYPVANRAGNVTGITGICAGIECTDTEYSESTEPAGRKSARIAGYNIATIVIVAALAVIAIIAIISVVCVQSRPAPQQEHKKLAPQPTSDNPNSDSSLELQ